MFAAGALCLTSVSCSDSGYWTRLPTRFEAGRFFVEPRLVSGETLVFFTDTGGGLFVFDTAVERFDLPTTGSGDDLRARLPERDNHAWIPLPTGDGSLPVLERPENDTPFGEADGMLGQQWFADRVWILDYPRRRMFLWIGDDRPRGRYGPPSPTVREGLAGASLAFRTTVDGERELSFPRIEVTVAGETLQLLLDTGATTTLTETSAEEVDDGLPRRRATSFLVESIFDRWIAEHPDWPRAEDAEAGSGQPMIRVPEIMVAGESTGPVWFTRRPDPAFREFMARFTDRPLDGALGGNAFAGFRLRIDYPAADAFLERPEVVNGFDHATRTASPVPSSGLELPATRLRTRRASSTRRSPLARDPRRG